MISSKEYPNIFGSFSPKGAYYVNPGHRPGLAYNHNRLGYQAMSPRTALAWFELQRRAGAGSVIGSSDQFLGRIVRPGGPAEILEIMTGISLQPATIDFGNFAAYQTTAFETLWRKITRNVWGQWRYEHQRPDYSGPEFTSKPAVRSIQAIQRQATPTEDILCFCGGGKDSLFAMTLLERLQLPYASFAYSNSVYGRADMQHKLIQNLLKHAQMTKQHQLQLPSPSSSNHISTFYQQKLSNI